MTQPKLPRLLPLTRVLLRDEDGDAISASDVFDDLTALDIGSYDLERGVILCRQRGTACVYAVRTKKRTSVFRALDDDDAKDWICRMISPIRSSRGWRLKIAIHALRVARRSLERADIELDVLTSHDPAMMAGRSAAKWRAVFEKKLHRAADELRRCLRAEAHAIWLVRYLIRQRACIRRCRGAQLSLPFPE